MEDILTFVVKIAHVGIAVDDIATAVKQYEMLGFSRVNDDLILEESYGVKVQMMCCGDFNIELLEPYEKGIESPIDTYIATKPYKMYHISYYVSDLNAQIELLKRNKFTMVDKPKPSQGMNGKLAVFMFNRRLGVVELVEQ